jgi:hypothetical protein
MERSFPFAKLPTITKLPQPSFEQEIPGRSAKFGLGFLCLSFAGVSESKRYLPVPVDVANPDIIPTASDRIQLAVDIANHIAGMNDG